MLTMLALNLGVEVPRDPSTGRVNVPAAKAALSAKSKDRRKGSPGASAYESALKKAMVSAYTLCTRGHIANPFFRAAIFDTKIDVDNGKYSTFEEVVDGLMENIRYKCNEVNRQNDDASSLLTNSFKKEFKGAYGG